MTTPRLIQHPVTKERRSVKAWAEYYKVPRSSLDTWLVRIPKKKVFEDLDNGRRPVKRGYKPSLWVDPITEEAYTLFEWAQKLGYNEQYIYKKVQKGELNLIKEKVYEQMKAAQLLEDNIPKVRLTIAKKNNALFCTNPRSGASLPAFEWAEFYKVSAHEFYQAMKLYGRNSVELYEFFERGKLGALRA